MHAAATGAAAAMPRNDALDYSIDVLLRRSAPADVQTPIDATTGAPSDNPARTDDRSGDMRRGEVARIYGRGLAAGTFADTDVRYLGQVVAQRSGIAPA